MKVTIVFENEKLIASMTGHASELLKGLQAELEAGPKQTKGSQEAESDKLDPAVATLIPLPKQEFYEVEVSDEYGKLPVDEFHKALYEKVVGSDVQPCDYDL